MKQDVLATKGEWFHFQSRLYCQNWLFYWIYEFNIQLAYRVIELVGKVDNPYGVVKPATLDDKPNAT